MPRAKPEERKAKLKEKQARIKAELQRLEARERETFRKKDARGKILIGGAILAALKQQAVTEEGVMKILRAYLTQPRDQALLKELYGFPFQATEEQTPPPRPTKE